MYQLVFDLTGEEDEMLEQLMSQFNLEDGQVIYFLL
jgi:hypothetical protein